jgi:glycosyltransferase Alg8
LVDEGRLCRGGASWARQLAALVLLTCLAVFLVRIAGGLVPWFLRRGEVLIALGSIACWRWGWFVLQNLRAITYRYYVFPRLRREAEKAVAQGGPVPEVTILATTYHEKPWITDAVFTSVFRELSTLEGLTRRPRVIVVTGCDDDDRNIQQVFEKFQQQAVEQPWWPPELILLRGDQGKRPALAAGMQAVADGNPHEDGVVVFMDADTLLQPGALPKILPLFRLSPPVAAVTTNETGWVKGPAWFAEWISLRFGLRHRSMCSVSLSGSLLCLTGRLSAFRASVIADPSFRAQVEHDVIDHWLWGPFEMLSGDDKSTWYWLGARGQRMLYVPDAMVTTIEVVQGSAVKRALANIRRWSGNSLRHSWRAIRLGPGKLGLFPWWSLLDQRLTMWTVLFGPAVALLALLAGRYEIAAGYLLWVLCSRVCHAAIAWHQGGRFSAYYVPLQVLSDWAVALTKMWVMFHPAKQNWLNRGARTLDSTRGSGLFALRTGLAHYLYGFSCVSLMITVGLFAGFFPLLREARLFLGPSPKPKATERAAPPPLENEQRPPDTTLPESGPKVLVARSGNTHSTVGEDHAVFQQVVKANQKNLFQSLPHERPNN